MSTSSFGPEPGQIWKDCDRRYRETGRYVRLVEVGTEHVIALVCTEQGVETSRKTRIKKSRLRTCSTGFTLFRDPQASILGEVEKDQVREMARQEDLKALLDLKDGATPTATMVSEAIAALPNPYVKTLEDLEQKPETAPVGDEPIPSLW